MNDRVDFGFEDSPALSYQVLRQLEVEETRRRRAELRRLRVIGNSPPRTPAAGAGGGVRVGYPTTSGTNIGSFAETAAAGKSWSDSGSQPGNRHREHHGGRRHGGGGRSNSPDSDGSKRGHHSRRSKKQSSGPETERVKPPTFGRKLYFTGPEDFMKNGAKELRDMLQGKYVVIVGDWHMRNLYKDLVLALVHRGKKLAEIDDTSMMGGMPFEGADDKIIIFNEERGAGRPFHVEEFRCFESESNNTLLEFVYSFRAYPNFYFKTFGCRQYGTGMGKTRAPDLFIMGSALGDLFHHGNLHYYGADYERIEYEYGNSLQKVIQFYDAHLSWKGTQMVWCTSPNLPYLTREVGSLLEHPSYPWDCLEWRSLKVKVQMLNEFAAKLFLSNRLHVLAIYHLALKSPLKDMITNFNSKEPRKRSVETSIGPEAMRYCTNCVLTIAKEIFDAAPSHWLQPSTPLDPPCVVELQSMSEEGAMVPGIGVGRDEADRSIMDMEHVTDHGSQEGPHISLSQSCGEAGGEMSLEEFMAEGYGSAAMGEDDEDEEDDADVDAGGSDLNVSFLLVPDDDDDDEDDKEEKETADDEQEAGNGVEDDGEGDGGTGDGEAEPDSVRRVGYL